MKLLKNKLKYKGCSITLSESEFLYLENKINECNSKKEVINVLKEFYLVSDTRYYKINHITEIAKNIIEVGRNYQTAEDYIDKHKAISDIIDHPLSINICSNTGKHIIKIKEEFYYFDSKEEAQKCLEDIKIKNV